MNNSTTSNYLSRLVDLLDYSGISGGFLADNLPSQLQSSPVKVILNPRSHKDLPVESNRWIALISNIKACYNQATCRGLSDSSRFTIPHR